jgi:hypothetical protein
MQQSEAGLLADESFGRVRHHRCEAASPKSATMAACTCTRKTACVSQVLDNLTMIAAGLP